jgi:hypothetical protein
MANAGRFDEAVRSQQEAIEVATLLKWDTGAMQQRLSSYQAQRPWKGTIVD